MGDRARFFLVAAILLLALCVGTAVTVRGIESELLARAQLGLAAAGIPFYDISIEGRDAVLRGFVASSDQEQRIVEVIAAVPGIRHVSSNLVVERVVERSVAANSGVAPTLRIQRARNTLRVSGRVASSSEASALIDAFRAALPRIEIVGGAAAAADVAAAPWTRDPAALAAVLAAASGDVRLLIQGGTAVLSGSVPDANALDRAVIAARAIGGLDWRFELHTLDGSVTPSGGAA